MKYRIFPLVILLMSCVKAAPDVSIDPVLEETQYQVSAPNSVPNLGQPAKIELRQTSGKVVVTLLTQPKLPGIGDAIVVQLPDGSNMLVDTGTPDAYRTLMGGLWALGIDELHYLVITHAHYDHDGSAAKVVEMFKGTLKGVWHNGSEPNAKYLKAALAAGIPVMAPKRGDKLELGSALIDVLHPAQKKHRDENDNSLVFRLSRGGKSMLFTGDIEHEAGADLARVFGKGLASTYLKVPHHGSAKFDPDFIRFAAADTALCSCRTIPGPSASLRKQFAKLGTEFRSNRDTKDLQVSF